jgi:16S rRNA (guanine1207-N2)-methyltransferase
MSRRKRSDRPLSELPVPGVVAARARPPLVVVLGSPAEVSHLLAGLPGVEATCFQFDLHQADRLREALAERGLKANVVTLPDLWDLPADFQTALFLPARGGERELKLDMVEQVFHVLRPGGTFLVWSPYRGDPFFPAALKKVFGKVHNPPHGGDVEPETVFWCQRGSDDRPRRRHEVTFQARILEGPSCRFVSRPGTFSYGRFDDGARALVEVAEIGPGDRVLDVGCGVGTNGTFAWQRAGPDGLVAFVDSNVRAAALAELNAKANGVGSFAVFATNTVSGPEEGTFDVALANPPYFAAGSIARLFIARARELLTPQGQFYLVTRQPEQVVEAVQDAFGEVEAILHRGYTILSA